MFCICDYVITKIVFILIHSKRFINYFSINAKEHVFLLKYAIISKTLSNFETDN